MHLSEEFVWWITIIELPVLTALMALIWRGRIDALNSEADATRRFKAELDDIYHDLVAFKLEIARSYASVALLKDTERRLSAHLLRIEAKLDPARRLTKTPLPEEET